MLFQAVLITIALALLLVTGLVCFFVGFRRLFLEQRAVSESPWYRQTLMHVGIICMAVVAIILLEGYRGTLPTGQSTANTLFSVAEAVFLLFGLISCAFLVRYVPYREQRRISG